MLAVSAASNKKSMFSQKADGKHSLSPLLPHPLSSHLASPLLKPLTHTHTHTILPFPFSPYKSIIPGNTQAAQQSKQKRVKPVRQAERKRQEARDDAKNTRILG